MFQKFCILLCLAFSSLHPLQAEYIAPKVYFSPKDHLADKLIELIDQEQKSIQACIYCLTHPKIGEALMRAKQRGVSIQVIIDPFSVKRGSPITKMEKAGILVLVWNPPKSETEKRKRIKAPLMHDKFCVFGSGRVWTGSFNFTRDADVANEENALVLEDTQIVRQYEKQFLEIKQKGTTPLSQFKFKKRKV